tara:strand:- start:195 stop:572 length:378 start_codon:yes stop_codon:yes gene_type:complete
MVTYKNPRYDITQDIILEVQSNGQWVTTVMRESNVMPDGVTLEELQAAFEANNPQDIAAYDGPSNSDISAEYARYNRNNLIAETDWWATSDRTMTAEQTAYRQALRDITSQSGWPFDITWPTKPE